LVSRWDADLPIFLIEFDIYNAQNEEQDSRSDAKTVTMIIGPSAFTNLERL